MEPNTRHRFLRGHVVRCISPVEEHLYFSRRDQLPIVGNTYQVMRDDCANGLENRRLVNISLNSDIHNYYVDHFELVGFPRAPVGEVSQSVVSLIKSRKKKK